MTAKTITFLGNFGTRNLGNECTLQAIIHNARRYLPDAKLNCICPDPGDVAERHRIPAFLLSYRYAEAFQRRTRSGQDRWLFRLIRRLFVRLPLEFREWLRAFRMLRGTEVLVMPGTGMLSDFGTPLDLHYEILKWSIIAKIRRCKVMFVSVGAGPIERPLSRWIVKSAVALADYRSYRDGFSRQYLDSIGVNISGDRVYPDLVFSLPISEIPARHRPSGKGCTVGLGLMDHYGTLSDPEQGEHVYQTYLRHVARFAGWLLEHEYAVRLLIGDLRYDERVRRDVFRTMEKSGWQVDSRQIIDEPISSVHQLWTQLEQTDVVVATRFHNLVFALMLSKPVIALSYHAKVSSLMAQLGLAEYCQQIGSLDDRRLVEQFGRLESNAEALRSSIRQRTDEYRRALDEQYKYIFSDT